jgi:glycosyltransferase involved in cell wall biosynthesis
MVGRNPGYVNSQGQILSDLFEKAGCNIISASSKLNRYARLADILATLATNRKRTQVVVIEVYSGPSFVVEDIASQLSKLLGQRVILWLHGGALPEFAARYPQWVSRVLSRADAIVAPSPFLARSFEAMGFEVRVIPNVIDLSKYTYRHREKVDPRLFWMRSFHPVWNPCMAVRVLALLKESAPEATLVMAGQDKGIQSDVEELARRLGVADSVRFAGFLDDAAKDREGALADIFINTNQVDNMPVALVEAWAMGLPVVTTSVGGIPDMISHGNSGLLVPRDDDQAMVRAIQSLLNDPSMASHLSANGRSLAARSSWGEVKFQWEQLFSEVLGQSGLKTYPRRLAEPVKAATSEINRCAESAE